MIFFSMGLDFQEIFDIIEAEIPLSTGKNADLEEILACPIHQRMRVNIDEPEGLAFFLLTVMEKVCK